MQEELQSKHQFISAIRRKFRKSEDLSEVVAVESSPFLHLLGHAPVANTCFLLGGCAIALSRNVARSSLLCSSIKLCKSTYNASPEVPFIPLALNPTSFFHLCTASCFQLYGPELCFSITGTICSKKFRRLGSTLVGRARTECGSWSNICGGTQVVQNRYSKVFGSDNAERTDAKHSGFCTGEDWHYWPHEVGSPYFR